MWPVRTCGQHLGYADDCGKPIKPPHTRAPKTVSPLTSAATSAAPNQSTYEGHSEIGTALVSDVRTDFDVRDGAVP